MPGISMATAWQLTRRTAVNYASPSTLKAALGNVAGCMHAGCVAVMVSTLLVSIRNMQAVSPTSTRAMRRAHRVTSDRLDVVLRNIALVLSNSL